MCSTTDYSLSYLINVETQEVENKPDNLTIDYNEDFKSKLLNYPMFVTNPFQKPPVDIPTQENDKPQATNKQYVSNTQITPPKTKTKPSGSHKLRPYSCDECGKSFLLKHHLTTHARTHTGIKPHTCIYCGKSFTHKHCLNTHLLLHSSERPYQCSECKKSFTLKHHLLTHMKVHSRENLFLCGECGRSFPSKRHLVTHCKFHAGERPFVCDECGESFAQKDHLVMHSRFHGYMESFVCSDCGATFSRKFELVNHEKLHGKTPYTCPVCNKEFLQKRTMVAHVRGHSEDFTCFHCSETFSNRNDLVQHKKSHIACSLPNPPLFCQECGSTFNTPEALAVHVRLHTGDKSLVNDIRNLTADLQNQNLAFAFGFNQNANFSAKRKNHLCQHCSKSFSTKQGFQQHQRRHPDGTCSLRTHVCEVCNKAFFQKNHLMLHQRQHGEGIKGGVKEEVDVVDCLKVNMGGSEGKERLGERQNSDLMPKSCV